MINKMMFQRDSPQSLSFSDLPISEKIQPIKRESDFERRPTTTPDEEFKFFHSSNGFGVEICSADDIFSHGKLLPFKFPTAHNATQEVQVWNSLRKDFFNPNKGRKMISHSYSAEYQRLEKDYSTKTLQTQMQKRLSAGKPGLNGSRPKWYLLMFGSVKAPAEMEMNNIRSRQRCRIQANSVPASAGDREEWKGRWKVLRALSCSGQAEVGSPLELQVARLRAG